MQFILLLQLYTFHSEDSGPQNALKTEFSSSLYRYRDGLARRIFGSEHEMRWLLPAVYFWANHINIPFSGLDVFFRIIHIRTF